MKKLTRGIALLVCLAMLLSMLPMTTFAAQDKAPAAEDIDPTIPIFENPQYSFNGASDDTYGTARVFNLGVTLDL